VELREAFRALLRGEADARASAVFAEAARAARFTVELEPDGMPALEPFSAVVLDGTLRQPPQDPCLSAAPPASCMTTCHKPYDANSQS
jgi:hypothetical protein